MKGYFGRDDISLTIHVPFGCGNKCAFCTNKKMYEEAKLLPVATQMKKTLFEIEKVIINCPDVKAFCITGGEPFINNESYHFTMAIINAIKHYEFLYRKTDKVKIYINTSLPKKWAEENFDLFMSLYYDTISGISISRHGKNYEADSEFFNVPIADDEFIAAMASKYPKRLRINCVCSTESSALDAVKRWYKHRTATEVGYLKLSLREDYTNTTFDNLKRWTDDNEKKYGFLDPVDEGGCNVCNTYSTKYDFVSIHKGLEHTCLYNAERDMFEINDLVLSPSGKLLFDWDESDERTKNLSISTIIDKSHLLDALFVEKARKGLGDKLFHREKIFLASKVVDVLGRMIESSLMHEFGSLKGVKCVIYKPKDKNEESLFSILFYKNNEAKNALLIFGKDHSLDFDTYDSGITVNEVGVERIDIIAMNEMLNSLVTTKENSEKVPSWSVDKNSCGGVIAPGCNI